jgi:hypothetical protein
MSCISALSLDASVTIPLLRINGVQNFADITSSKGKIMCGSAKRQVTRDRISDGILKRTEFLSNAKRNGIKVQRHFRNVNSEAWKVGYAGENQGGKISR